MVDWLLGNPLYVVVGLLGLLAVITGAAAAKQKWFDEDEDEDDVDDPPRDGDGGDLPETSPPAGEKDDNGVVELPRPEISNARFGLLGQLWKMRQHYRKEEKLLSKGYVKWFLISDTWPEAKYVKPDAKGGGLYVHREDGEPYLFPQNAMIPDSRQGIRTVIHKRGEADPINLNEPSDVSIPTDVLDEYLTMSVTSSPPSFWDNLGWDTADLVRLAVGGSIAFAVVWAVVGGGF